MTKRPNRQRPKNDPVDDFPMEYRETRKRDVSPLKPQTESQAAYIRSIEKNDLTFGLGPAGTGKTFVATVWACDALREGRFDKLIVTRPAVEAGESIGFLPGEMDEKFSPYFAPVADILNQRLGKSHVEGMMRTSRIVAQPLAFMRGMTFRNAIVILDEAQNTTPSQMKMFLTRLGEGSKLIVNGDIKQSDISGPNGLAHARKILDGLPRVGLITFRRDDIVRHGLVREIIDRYEGERDDGSDDDGPFLPGFITGK